MLIRYCYVVVSHEGKLISRELRVEYIDVIRVDPTTRILSQAVLPPKLYLLYTSAPPSCVQKKKC